MTIASCQPGAASGAHALRGSACGPDRQTAVRSLATKAGADAGSELAAGRANPGKTFAMLDMIALRDSKLFALARSPDVACGANRRTGRPRRRTVVAAAVDALFGYFPLQYAEARDFMRSTRIGSTNPTPLPWPNSATPTRARRKS